jgi:hypothetical protein
MVYSPKVPTTNFSILHVPGPAFYQPPPPLPHRAKLSAGALSRPLAISVRTFYRIDSITETSKHRSTQALSFGTLGTQNDELSFQDSQR